MLCQNTWQPPMKRLPLVHLLLQSNQFHMKKNFSILIISVLIFVPILCVYTIFTTKFIMRIIALCVYTILSALPVKMVRSLLTTVLPVLSIHHICRSSAFQLHDESLYQSSETLSSTLVRITFLMYC